MSGTFAPLPIQNLRTTALDGTRQLWIACWRAAASILGKTNLHEFAFGATNVNPHYGPVRNPWGWCEYQGNQ
jgi:hypothetical protein